jgi:transcriptional regulator with XRE-family HTH domain
MFCRNFRKLFAEYKKKTGRGVLTLATALRTQKRDIHRFLSGERVPSLDTMQELAIALGVKIEDFFREDL